MHRPHWAITNPTPEHRGQVDDEYLHSKVAEYLAHPQWQSDIVEWAMVDAMVWREMVAFRDHTASERPGRVGWMGKLPGRVAAAAIGFVAPIWWLLGLHGAHDPAADLWIILYAAALVIWADWRIRIVRKKVLGETLEAKAGKLLARMATACGELDGTTLSLTRVREELKAAADAGAVWPREVWAILDTAISRNPGNWNMSAVRSSPE